MNVAVPGSLPAVGPGAGRDCDTGPDRMDSTLAPLDGSPSSRSVDTGGRLFTLGDAVEFVRWRKELLMEYEDACFHAARERAATAEERAFWSRWIAERSRTRSPGA